MQLQGRKHGRAGFRCAILPLDRNHYLHACRDPRYAALRHAPFEHTMDQHKVVFHVFRTSDRRRMQPPLSHIKSQLDLAEYDNRQHRPSNNDYFLSRQNSNVCARIGKKGDIRIEAPARSGPASCRKQSTAVLCGLHFRGSAEATDELDDRQISSIAPLHVFLLLQLRFKLFYDSFCTA